jgi:pimeloyl-ACP methyl ester carboxylesterase
VPTAVTMPRLGLSMTEGTVVEWHARCGDPVASGAVLLTVESEKAQVEIEAFAAGVLAAVYVEPGATVPVGALLGAIAAPDEAFDPRAFAAAFVPDVPAGPASGPTAAPHERAPVTARRGEPTAAPAARALAKRLGVDLAAVTGTGPGGRITVEDVERMSRPYAVEGSGPPLLLVAGFAVDASGWRPQVEGLRGHHTVVTYDHRGIGGARPAAPGLRIADLADDARTLLADLGATPAVVVGASMGAAVALELALTHPHAVRGLVLLTPAVERDARLEAVLRSWCVDDAPTADSRIRAMLPWLLGREHLAHAGRREAAAAALRVMAARTPAAALRAHADALVAWLGTRTDDLARIVAPALVVAGEDDVLTPRAHAEALARRLPGARLEVLAGAGHALGIERTEAVNALVRDLAARVR